MVSLGYIYDDKHPGWGESGEQVLCHCREPVSSTSDGELGLGDDWMGNPWGMSLSGFTKKGSCTTHTSQYIVGYRDIDISR